MTIQEHVLGSIKVVPPPIVESCRAQVSFGVSRRVRERRDDKATSAVTGGEVTEGKQQSQAAHCTTASLTRPRHARLAERQCRKPPGSGQREKPAETLGRGTTQSGVHRTNLGAHRSHEKREQE